MPISEFNSEYGERLDDTDYTTIGGYVFGQLGRLPRAGDRVTAGNHALEVVEMEGRRVKALRLHTPPTRTRTRLSGRRPGKSHLLRGPFLMPPENPRAELRTALLDLGYRLAGVRTPEEAARIIASVAQDVLGWDAYSLDLYFAETETVQAIVSMDRIGNGEPVDVPHAYASGPPGPMTRKVLAEGAQLILRGLAAPTTEGLTPFGAVSRPSASLMFVPVRHGERVAGILSIQSYTPNAYDPDDLAMLQTLADHCGERPRAAPDRGGAAGEPGPAAARPRASRSS